jgi:hypothetical protein
MSRRWCREIWPITDLREREMLHSMLFELDGRAAAERAIGRDTAWVSRSLRGPGNWTLRTLGELVEALNGEIEIKIHALEDSPSTNSNYHAYAGYEPVPAASSTVGTLTFGDPTKQKIIKDAFPTSGASALSAVPGGA